MGDLDTDVREAIGRVLRLHGESMVRGDARGAAAMFALRARWMPAGMPDVHGREEIQKVISEFLRSAGPPGSVQHTTEELFVMGEFALGVGSVRATFRAADGEPTQSAHR